MTREDAIKNYIMPALIRTWNDDKCIEIISAIEQEPNMGDDMVKAIKSICSKCTICKGCKYLDSGALRCKFVGVPSEWEIE